MASKPIGSLYAALGLDSSQFDSGISNAQKKLKGFGDFKFGRGLKGGIDEIDAGMRGLASRAGIAGAALSSAGIAGVATAAAFVGLAGALAKTRQALAFADEIGDTANKLAITTDALQEYRYAVHQLGGEYADADKALESFAQKFGAAHAQLTKKAGKPFEALGLDATSFKTTEEALQAVIEKIAALESAAEQAAIADKLGLTSMLPAIRAGGEAIDGLRKKAHDLGYVMDAELISKAGEANDKFEDLQQILGVQLNSAFVDLAPVLLSVTGGLASMAREVNHLIGEIKDAFPDLQKWVALIAKAGGSVLKDLPGGAVASASLQAGKVALAKAAQDGRARQLGSRVSDMLAGKPVDLRGTEWDPAKKAGAGGGASLLPVGGGGKGPRDRTADALADVELKELNARMALTENVERLSEMKARQVDIETKKANQDVAQDVAEGSITAAAGKILVAKNNELADLEKQKIAREATAQLVAQEFEYREAILADLDKTSDLEAEYAATAAERNRIEAAALAGRQKLERDRLDEDLKQQLQAEAITESGVRDLKAAQADRQAAERKAQARKAQARIIDEETDLATSTLRKQQDQLGALSMVAKSTYARAVIEAKILKLKQQEERLEAEKALRTATPGSAEAKVAQDRLDGLKALHEAEQEVARESTSLAHAIEDATGNVRDFKDAFNSRNWAGLLDALGATIDGIRASFAQNGVLGGLLTTGSALGSLIGGKTGKAVGNVAGGALLGLAGGNLLADTAFALGPSAIGGTGLLGAGAVNFLAGPLAAALPWVGLIAGLASVFLGSKPSNHAGIAQIDGNTIRSVSSGKENDETQNAANQTAQTILQAEQLLAQAGVTLSQTVSAVDLGTRDKTRIVLSDGTEFRTNAVGDPAEAAETALKRLLQGAIYADDALKQLVESALAAGKGFDDIAAILQAQQVGKQLADQILQLTDPKAYAKKQVTDNIRTQRDAAKALFDQGALTADQLAAINVQLDQLEALRLADVMKDFGDAATSAADDWKKASQSLSDWLASLTGQTASGAQAAAQAYAALQAAGIAARAGDLDAAEKIPDLGNAYIAAAKAIAGSQQEYLMAVARARAIGSSVQLDAAARAGMDASALSAANSPVVGNTTSQLVAGDASSSDAAGDTLAALKSEIVSLRDDIRAAATALARNGSDTKKLLDRWDGEGLPAERAS
jgi:hypothetical protein